MELSEGNGSRQEDFLARLLVQGQRHVVLVHMLQGLLRNSLFIRAKNKNCLQAPLIAHDFSPTPPPAVAALAPGSGAVPPL